MTFQQVNQGPSSDWAHFLANVDMLEGHECVDLTRQLLPNFQIPTVPIFSPANWEHSNIPRVSASFDPYLPPNSTRPHIQCIVDKTVITQALVDSGADVSMASVTLLSKLARKHPVGPPIPILDCHSATRNTIGQFQMTLDIPHQETPISDSNINVHVSDSLSSELLLGQDWLSSNGAVIRCADNSVFFCPKEAAALALSENPLIATAASTNPSIGGAMHQLTSDNTFTISPTKQM